MIEMIDSSIQIGSDSFVLRSLGATDAMMLGIFFTDLSAETRSRFGPHPLHDDHAGYLCSRVEEDPAHRFVLLQGDRIVGYFILDPVVPVHEAARYQNYGISLSSYADCMFAPCMSDDYQNKGLGGKTMPHLIRFCKTNGYVSMVLLGGTQEPNARAVAFYRKAGFQELGRFQTEVWNIDMRFVL